MRVCTRVTNHYRYVFGSRSSKVVRLDVPLSPGSDPSVSKLTGETKLEDIYFRKLHHTSEYPKKDDDTKNHRVIWVEKCFGAKSYFLGNEFNKRIGFICIIYVFFIESTFCPNFSQRHTISDWKNREEWKKKSRICLFFLFQRKTFKEYRGGIDHRIFCFYNSKQETCICRNPSRFGTYWCPRNRVWSNCELSNSTGGKNTD